MARSAARLGSPFDPEATREILLGVSREEYLLADQPSELERLQLQSRVWEPSGWQLLAKLGDGSGVRALDVGCGALGWLRILSEWVGPSGRVVGADIDQRLLDAARSFLEAEEIANVELTVDDLFDSKLEPESFDLVHARYVIAPLGRGAEQVASHRRLVRPGGSLVLEEWDLGSWHFNPPAPAADRLILLLSEIFASLGGEAGRVLPDLLGEIGIEEPEIDAHVIALRPGHPYLRLPLQFSVALESRLLETLSRDDLAALRQEAERELVEPVRWGTTFTLIQAWGRRP
jgi:SAM-dependent methyltransferase